MGVLVDTRGVCVRVDNRGGCAGVGVLVDTRGACVLVDNRGGCAGGHKGCELVDKRGACELIIGGEVCMRACMLGEERC